MRDTNLNPRSPNPLNLNRKKHQIHPQPRAIVGRSSEDVGLEPGTNKEKETPLSPRPWQSTGRHFKFLLTTLCHSRRTILWSGSSSRKNKEVGLPSPVIITGTSPEIFYQHPFPRYHCHCCSPGVELERYECQEIVVKIPQLTWKKNNSSMLLFQLSLAAGLELLVFAG